MLLDVANPKERQLKPGEILLFDCVFNMIQVRAEVIFLVSAKYIFNLIPASLHGVSERPHSSQH